MTDHAFDPTLISRARSGDRDAIGAIYGHYRDHIYNYLYRHMGDSSTAEDLCSDVFIRMIEGVGRYEQREWAISAWLFRIAHDRMVDLIRRDHCLPQQCLEEDTVLYDAPDAMIQQQLDQEEVWDVVGTLERAQQWVVRLRFLESLSVREVAKRTGRSEGAVKSLQYRAMQNLARRLKHHRQDE